MKIKASGIGILQKSSRVNQNYFRSRRIRRILQEQ